MLSNSAPAELHHQIAGDLLKPALHPTAGNCGGLVKMCGITQLACTMDNPQPIPTALRATDAVNRLDVGGASGLKI